MMIQAVRFGVDEQRINCQPLVRGDVEAAGRFVPLLAGDILKAGVAASVSIQPFDLGAHAADCAWPGTPRCPA
ncbi:hypothetical protein, partial [Burkholderia cenocepacia]|uniref:hypothetical protein n=1 Tax=Burkholderia cenocepacia TaxID=95486 RepID=UPI002238E239